MSWSPDGMHWWDGVAWRAVAPDRRFYSDGMQWIPLPQAAFSMPSAGGPPSVTPAWTWNGQAWVPTFAAQPGPTRPRQPDVLAAGIVVLGIAVTVVAAFLPWAKAESFGFSLSKSGVDGGDGWITIVAAAIALLPAAWLYLGLARIWARVGIVVLAAAIGAVAGIDWADVNTKLSSVNSSGVAIGKVGEGIYLTVIGAALLVIAVAVSLRPTARIPAPVAA